MPFKIARSILFLALTLALTAACSDDGQSTPADSGASDSAPKDGKAADDTGTQVDGLKTDSALVDMAALDGPLVDKGSVDSGGQDSAQKDGATADLVKSDMPAVDSGPAADSGPAWDGAAPAKKPNWVKILGNRGGATITSVAAHPSGGVAVLGLFHGQVNLGGGALISKGQADLFVARYSSSGAHIWSKSFGGTGSDEGKDLAVDGSGNITLSGSFQASVNLGGTTLTSKGSNDYFLAQYKANGTHIWSKSFGGTGSDYANRAAVDSSGNIAVIGYFTGSVSFGGATLTSKGSNDYFLAQYKANGTHIWSKALAGTSSYSVEGLAVDKSGNIIVSGRFTGSTSFGGATLTSTGGDDVFVAKYKSNGQHLWSKNFGGINSDSSSAVAVDSSGNITVAGRFNGSANFGGTTLTSKGGHDIFVARYSSSGLHLWSKGFGGSGNESLQAAVVDSSGNCTVTGWFNGNANFGGITLTGKGGYDIFVAQYKASNGAHLWSKVLGGTGHDYGYGLAADSSGNIIVIGHFLGIASFGGTSLTSKGSYDGFIAQFKANGQHIWSKNFGGTSQDYARGVTVDGSGNITVTGSYSGSANFGGATLTSKGSYDLFMAQYKSGGQHVWSKAFGSTANDNGLALAADSSGNITLTGVIYSNTSLGGATLGNKGAWDVFVARYKANGQHIWSRAHGGVGSDYSSAVAVDSSGNSTVVGKFSEIVNFGYGAEAGYNTLFMANYAP